MSKKIEIKIALLIFFYGLFSNNFLILENKEKAFIGIFLFSVPLLFSLTKASKLAKIYVIWFGVFLILLSITFFLSTKKDFVTIKPEVNNKIKTQLCDINDIQKISTDSHGFRVTKNIDYDNKASNKYRIFAIGGSTTAQIYIDQLKTWTALLQEKLDQKYPNQDFEVINSGVNGTRAVNHLATLKEIIRYQPDMVIFLMGINDWNHHVKNNYSNITDVNNKDIRFADVIHKLSFEKTWDNLIVPIRNKIKVDLFGIKKEKKREIKEDFWESDSLFRSDKRDFKPANILQSYKEYLDEINKICDEYKIKCVFLTQPNGYKKEATKEYRKLFWMTPTEEKNYTLTFESAQYMAKLYNNYMIGFAKKNNKILCDIDAKIPASYKYMCDDCHFSLAGARKVSELLFQCIENKL